MRGNRGFQESMALDFFDLVAVRPSLVQLRALVDGGVVRFVVV